MRTSPYREDDRAVLTNEHIKQDLKKTGNRYLLKGAWQTPLLAFLTFLTYMLAKSAQSESPVLFWLSAIFTVVFTVSTIQTLVISVWYGATYLRAAAGNRFVATTDTLEGKEDGYAPPLALLILVFLLRFSHLLLAYHRPDRYRFSAVTYEVAVRDYHFAFDRNFAMNERTLFRHSEVGDKFLLVSLKPGKPVKIYPEKRFRYTDSSPL